MIRVARAWSLGGGLEVRGSKVADGLTQNKKKNDAKLEACRLIAVQHNFHLLTTCK